MQDKIYRYWLCNVDGIGDRTHSCLLRKLGSAERIFHAPEEEFKGLLGPRQLENLLTSRRIWRPEEEFAGLQKSGIRFLVPEDADYPGRLRTIPDPPMTLFCKGKLPPEEMVSVAVIGARECSDYGRYVAGGLGKLLGEYGVPVISGMARGIDGISQQAALKAGGTSFGVLGCGVDICYPQSNEELYEQLLEGGGVLSSFPPGTQPRPQNFPPRNRIVSGLADVIVVVEARAKSGTLITVDMALEQGKEVYVVPGRITDRLSDGCNRLLTQGAGVLLSPVEFLEEMHERFNLGKMETVGEEEAVNSALAGLPEQMKRVYGALDLNPRSLEEIGEKIPEENRPDPVKLNTLLLQLCMKKMATQISPGYFKKEVEI